MEKLRNILTKIHSFCYTNTKEAMLYAFFAAFIMGLIFASVFIYFINMDYLNDSQKLSYINQYYLFDASHYQLKNVSRKNVKSKIIPKEKRSKINTIIVSLHDKNDYPIKDIDVLLTYINTLKNQQSKIGNRFYKIVKNIRYLKKEYKNNNFIIYDSIFYNLESKIEKRIVAYIIYNEKRDKYLQMYAILDVDVLQKAIDEVDVFARSLKIVK